MLMLMVYIYIYIISIWIIWSFIGFVWDHEIQYMWMKLG